ncbi:tetratricopeptide repeat protein [Vulgatibacter sp.]|uniref:tetratricopeptide repeat protein n=1 Tax=Vulgatibacter sp. TaxID=1971226 RepID=UPI0035699D9F
MRNISKTLCGVLVAAALAVPSIAIAQADLTPAIQAYNAGQFDRAAAYMHDFIAQSGATAERAKAEFYLGQTLEKMGLYQSALYTYANILKEGPAHPHYVQAVEGIVDVSEALDDDLFVPSLFDKEYNDEFQRLRPEYLQKVNYMVGMVSYRAGRLEDAEAFLGVVPPENSYYARARYLLGIVSIAKGQQGGNLEGASQEALGYFNEVLSLQNSLKLTYLELNDLRDLSRLGMARTYYGLGDYANAVKFYEAVPRFSPHWDQALFENGWARFFNDDYGGALGTLQALHAPQFEGAFAPESWTLKSTIYYTACLYDEAKDALGKYTQNYTTVPARVQPLLDEGREFAYYWGLISQASQRTKLPRAVYNYLAGNKRVSGFQRYINQLESEKSKLMASGPLKNSALQAEMIQVIDQQKNILENVAGKFIRARLEDAVATIRHFDAQAEIIKFETAKAEKERLERGAEFEARLASQTLERPVIPAEDYEYWNFQNEFWLDEIGYYQFTLKNACAQPEQE